MKRTYSGANRCIGDTYITQGEEYDIIYGVDDYIWVTVDHPLAYTTIIYHSYQDMVNDWGRLPMDDETLQKAMYGLVDAKELERQFNIYCEEAVKRTGKCEWR